MKQIICSKDHRTLAQLLASVQGHCLPAVPFHPAPSPLVFRVTSPSGIHQCTEQLQYWPQFNSHGTYHFLTHIIHIYTHTLFLQTLYKLHYGCRWQYRLALGAPIIHKSMYRELMNTNNVNHYNLLFQFTVTHIRYKVAAL